MEPFNRLSGSEPPFAGRGPQLGSRAAVSRSRESQRTPKAYRVLDQISGGLIFFMAVFTPWAFGTTQDWSILTMNFAAWTLGALLAAKWIVRWQTDYRPPRWGQTADFEPADLIHADPPRRDGLTIALAALTGAILLYVLIGTVNSRATFIESQRRFEYRDCINWLPHSYDQTSSWHALWIYSALACFFWATRDWLLGKGGSGRRKRRHAEEGAPGRSSAAGGRQPALGELASLAPISAPLARSESKSPYELPPRLRLLLWIVCINGSVLALESILQRLSGTNKLLWLVVPRFNSTTDAQFGPYAYRANAASYFNLLWPVALGFWLALRQAARRSPRAVNRLGTGSYILLLPGTILMAACPIISTTRGGTLIALFSLFLMLALLLWCSRKESFWFRAGACSIVVIIVAFSATLGLKDLVPRFKTIFTDQMSRRTEIYDNAIPIARDFPVFGTGAGTFGSMYYLYRGDLEQDWAAYAHDDWLETRVTLGWVGFSIALLMLGIVFARWFVGGGIRSSWEFVASIWVAVAGCLLHGKFDFPFQVYSLLLLFLLLAAILFCLSRTATRA